MDVIVVGVDGSRDSRAALRHALREARKTDATVRVVGVWHMPALAYEAPAPLDDLSAELREGAAGTIREALAAEADLVEGVDVQELIREGEPGRVLVAEADGAKQLVVGSRGHGAVGELVLGSVSHYCCRHANCPVTVIPHGCREPE
jgi:nucleotide-binding universal stress UspA family protein